MAGCQLPQHRSQQIFAFKIASLQLRGVIKSNALLDKFKTSQRTMRQGTIDSRDPDLLIRDTTRPMWYIAFAIISLFDIAMIILMMLAPNYAALWLALLLAMSVLGGARYKSQKYRQPLPTDNSQQIGTPKE
jgi:hypothetical protein